MSRSADLLAVEEKAKRAATTRTNTNIFFMARDAIPHGHSRQANFVHPGKVRSNTILPRWSPTMTPGKPEEIAREAMSYDYQYAVLSVLGPHAGEKSGGRSCATIGVR
jgi:hypothetical protein